MLNKMTELYPLESQLERRLPEVGIELERRVYRTELGELARQDDKLDEMSGAPGLRDLYGKVIREEIVLTSEENLVLEVLGDITLSQSQRDVESYPNLIFKRTGFRSFKVLCFVKNAVLEHLEN